MAAGILERGQAVRRLTRRVSTVYALSSGRPPAGIAVIRVSGPAASAVLLAIAGEPLPPARMMTLRPLVDPGDRTPIDRALVVRFDADASVTGEDLVEFHVHGGVAVVAAMLRVLSRQPGLLLAAPGEFTRRAFDNGRVDLAQVEGLADLIDADTEAARTQALAQANGRLALVVDGWRSTLIDLLAEVEAGLDFAEAEDDVAAGLAMGASSSLAGLRREIAAAIDDARRGEQMRDGLTIAVTGAANVGKSSLINALVKRDVAIVSEYAGTTRDVIEARLDLGGVAVTLIDTAGLREADDPVEREGIRRGQTRAAEADLVLDVGTDAQTAKIINKIDTTGQTAGYHGAQFFLSAKSGEGVGDLLDWLRDWASMTVRPAEPALVTRERQRLALADGLDELTAIDNEEDAVLIAERLRRATRALGVVTGRVGVDDVLDAIFGRFCIGK